MFIKQAINTILCHEGLIKVFKCPGLPKCIGEFGLQSTFLHFMCILEQFPYNV